MASKLLTRAKINLYLHVVDKHDGYHHLDSVISFPEFGDEMKIKEASTDSVIVTNCDAVAGEDNILWKTLTFLRKNLPHMPAGIQIDLHKNIPLKSGFGGGSSNAGGLIATCINQWNSQIDLKQWVTQNSDSIIKEIGADVPSCTLSHLGEYSHKIKHAGHVEDIIPSKDTYHMILAKPYHSTCTIGTFRRFGKISNKEYPKFTKEIDLIKFSKGMENQLPRTSLQTTQMEETLKGFHSCHIGRMSGSGSGCFGVFENSKDRDVALKKLVWKFPDSWCLPTKIRI